MKTLVDLGTWKEYMSWQGPVQIIKTVKLVKEFGGHPGMNMRLSRLSSGIISLHSE
jgi:hypothetical protein